MTSTFNGIELGCFTQENDCILCTPEEELENLRQIGMRQIVGQMTRYRSPKPDKEYQDHMRSIDEHAAQWWRDFEKRVGFDRLGEGQRCCLMCVITPVERRMAVTVSLLCSHSHDKTIPHLLSLVHPA